MISKINYCNSLYVSLPNCVLRKLQSFINRSSKLIYSFSPLVPTTSYLIELRWIPAKARIEFKICVLAFQALKFGEIKYLADLLNIHNVHVGMSLRNSDDPFQLKMPRASKQCFSERAVSYLSPCLLNRLSALLNELDSIATFKSKFMTFMFERAFDLMDQNMNESYRL